MAAATKMGRGPASGIHRPRAADVRPRRSNHRVASTVRFYSRIFSAPDYPGMCLKTQNRSFSDDPGGSGDAVTDDKGEKKSGVVIPG